MRGSDQSASLYWLARMLEGGEDPLYVARRLVRFASEDIGECSGKDPDPGVHKGWGCMVLGAGMLLLFGLRISWYDVDR